ncbi:ureidoglycolate lyase [Anaerobacillus sp. CMMVII]|uniref:ureidoglycolate lyase n=1 Tax=Anaerobacillus sp. CMMVII TaxID=2755588 RepID=UPI0021C4D607|nr:ureidoglycolate lyase [Anaerobacillus sp. CMMVII]MCT8137649.1 ureidoglycolate lyase [Anaerobacillus sp. CMMVII]
MKESFAPYGEIIEVNPFSSDTFQVVLSEEQVNGWRIAVSNLSGKRIVKKLGLHPNTRESFEPLNGVVVIVVATKEEPDNIKAFLLDQPVCLYKNVWHANIALSAQAAVKITENATEIESLHHTLKEAITVGLVSSDF